MKKFLEIALGIVTSVGGFLEAGSIATAAQGGAAFGYRLSWAILIGTIALIVLVEMSGRLAAVSGHTITDAIRERFGGPFFVLVLVVVGLVSYLVLATEIAGVATALSMATGLATRWWAVPVAFAVWILLWRGTFGMVEYGVSLLGLVTIAFLVGALKLHPAWAQLGTGLLPHRPPNHAAQYWFVAVSILGASISPYLYMFYSSGAIEDHWDESYLGMNRLVATLGMTFGGVLSLAVLVVAALVFAPKGTHITQYEQLGFLLVPPLGHWGRLLFIASLGIACFGAAAEIALATAYMSAQGFGWQWSENIRPAEGARFSLIYTLLIALAAIPVVLGVDPLKLTNVSMALTAASLPVTVLPLLVLMNDRAYLHDHTNSWLGNGALILIALLSIVLLVVAFPLQLMGGGG